MTSANIVRPVENLPIFTAVTPNMIAIRAGAVIAGIGFAADTPVETSELVAGIDYEITLVDGQPVATPCGEGLAKDAIGGFHFAPGGNASACQGGDATPALNPLSIWDAGFRPACPNPRGMTLVEHNGLRFWCDIYLLGVDHLAKGTSRFGETIADGDDRPAALDGKGKTRKLDYQTAVAIYAHNGKKLLGAEEFFAAAYGVTERSSARDDPKATGLDAARTSRFGLMQATGNMWVWGHDGHPDEPRPSIFGGSWIFGGLAGSRYAYLDIWPDDAHGSVSARGRCDHLNLDGGA